MSLPGPGCAVSAVSRDSHCDGTNSNLDQLYKLMFLGKDSRHCFITVTFLHYFNGKSGLKSEFMLEQLIEAGPSAAGSHLN